MRGIGIQSGLKQFYSTLLLGVSVSVIAAQAMAQQATTQTAESATQLDTITITGTGKGGYAASNSTTVTKTDTPLKETSASVSVVSAKQIEDQGARSVPEALRYSAGIVSEYRGASNVGDETIVRGFGYVPRFVDGLSMSSGAVEPWLLESVSVLKGPSSLLYGQSNPGGLLDMTTKTANGERINRVEMVTGTNARAETRFDFARPIENSDFSWRLVGLGSRADTQEEGLKTTRFAIAPSFRWTPSDTTTLDVTARYQREPHAAYRNFRERLGTLDPTIYGFIPADFLVGDPAHERATATSTSFGYRFEHELNPGLTFRQKARLTNSDSSRYTLVWGTLGADQRTISRTASDSVSEGRQALIDNQLEARFSLGETEHVLLGGVDVQYTKSSSLSWRGTANSIDWMAPDYGNLTLTGYTQSGDSVSRTGQQGFYLQDQITWDRLHINAGLRYDQANNRTFNNRTRTGTDIDSHALSGRLGALYAFDNGFAPYVSYSTSFEPVTQVPQAGEAAFRPTEGEQFEAGVKWASQDDSMMVTASVYDLRQSNVLKSIDGTTPVAYEQVGEIRSRGFELEARGQITDNFALVGGYSYNDSKISKSNKPAEIGMPNDRVPMHQASLWGKYVFDNGFDIGVGVRYTGTSKVRNDAFRVAAHTLVDLAIGYDFGKLDSKYEGLRAQLNISNLADTFYTASCAGEYSCFVGNERVVTASVGYQW